MEAPITTARHVEIFRPAGSPRAYHIAPLTIHERIAYRAQLTRDAGIMPAQHEMFLAMRAALAEVNPPNKDELLAAIDGAQAIRVAQEAALMNGGPLPPLTAEEQVTMGHSMALEARLSTVPLYAALLNQREAHSALAPVIAAQHALRGWEGLGLPEFARVNGVVPAELLEVLDGLGELAAIGWRAQRLAMPGSSAVGNSASPSPSPAPPIPAAAETSRKAGVSGSSRGRNGKATRAS